MAWPRCDNDAAGGQNLVADLNAIGIQNLGFPPLQTLNA